MKMKKFESKKEAISFLLRNIEQRYTILSKFMANGVCTLKVMKYDIVQGKIVKNVLKIYPIADFWGRHYIIAWG